MASESLQRVLIINTGGTIGMVHAEEGNPRSPLVPADTWTDIAHRHSVLRPEELGVETAYYRLDPLLDSSDITYEHWRQLASIIGEEYSDYLGFVVFHGTDTMCYTASALSFMLTNLGKPVVLTGSQLPLVEPRSDALQNIITSIQIAGGSALGLPNVSEVCIFFRDHLLRGNRARKLSSSGYVGFASPNYPALATAGERIVFSRDNLRPSPPPEAEFYVNTLLDSRVMVVEIFPGLDPEILRRSVTGGVKGLVLKTYGAGNAPSNEGFLGAIEGIVAQGTVVVDVTQCPQGQVELGLYEASLGLLTRGVVSGVDMTPEAAVCKLMFLLGQGLSKEEVARLMQVDLVGEQSQSIHTVGAGEGLAAPVSRGEISVPVELETERLEAAVVRFEKVTCELDEPQSENLAVRIFLNHPHADERTDELDARFAGEIRTAGGSEGASTLFCDVTEACRRVLEAGRVASVVITAAGGSLEWKGMYWSFFCDCG